MRSRPLRTVTTAGGAFLFLAIVACGGGGGLGGGWTSWEPDGPHTATIQAMAISPDGRLLGTASEDRTARIWTLPDREPVRVLPHTDFGSGVAFSPDGARVATAGLDGVRVWSTASWDHLQHVAVRASAVSWAGGLIAIAQKESPEVLLLDGQTLLPVHKLQGHADPVVALELVAGGSRLVTGSRDLTARLWDTATGEELQTFIGHRGPVLAVDLSADGGRLVTASVDKTARIWDVQSGEPIRQLSGHTDWVTGVDLHAGDEVVATSGRDGTLRLWDARNGATLLKIDLEDGPLEEVRFTHGDVAIAVGQGIQARGIAEVIADHTPSPRARPPALDARCRKLAACGVALVREGGESVSIGFDVVRQARELDLQDRDGCKRALAELPAALERELPAGCAP